MTSGFTVVTARGSGRALGVAHAHATAERRDDVARWVEAAVRAHDPARAVVAARLREVEAVLARHAPETLEQTDGMAGVYGLPPEHLLVAVLGTYFASAEETTARARSGPPGPDQGCSTFALSTGGTGPGPVLAKNRDTRCDYLEWQTVLHVEPDSGHRWTAVSTAGAPDVHSSGMNAAGLAVADTHVPSSDVGPGLPRFTAMRRVLEECSTTAEALETLRSLPVLGLGNLLLADRDGVLAVVECGHSGPGVRLCREGRLVATNHYVTPECSGANLQAATSGPGRDSRARHAWLDAALRDRGPAAVRENPAALMAAHGRDGTGAVCVHEHDGSATISTAVFRPREGTAELVRGLPCRAAPAFPLPSPGSGPPSAERLTAL